MPCDEVILSKRQRLRRWRYGLIAITLLGALGLSTWIEFRIETDSRTWKEPVWINGELLNFDADIKWIGDETPAYLSARFFVRPISATNPLASTQAQPMTVEAFDPPFHVRLVRADGSGGSGATEVWMDFADEYGFQWSEDGRSVVFHKAFPDTPMQPGGGWSVKGVLRLMGHGLPYGIGFAGFLAFLILCFTSEDLHLRAGRCRNCNYDMRGGGDVCPECGAARGN